MSIRSNEFIRTQAYIGGEWVEAQSGDRFAVTDPASGEEIVRVADGTAADAERAVAAAYEAFPDWAGRTAAERSRILRRWYELMVVNAEELGALLTAEMGKPLREAIGEVQYGAGYLEWFAEEAKRAYGDVIPSNSPDGRMMVLKQPVGVCAAITPWNFPSAMLMRKASAALAAGCTMVSKPAEDTPLSALATAALAEEAGVPAGVYNVLPTSRAAEVGEVLTTDERVRKVTFTGSTEVGRLLLAQSATTVKRVSMELGGNAPFIVFDDADLDAAVEGALASKYRNAGQTCVCANRFYVQQGIAEAFTEKLAAKVEAMKVGPGDEPDTDIGPLINADALEKIERLVTGAREKGAELLCGGEPHEAGPLFYAPTVLTGITKDMEIVREEIFGPVTAITTFETEDEAVFAANDTIYGLAAYCYTRDVGRVYRMSERLEYGMVGINQGVISAVNAPFGGIKQSGMGREGSRHGLDDYLEMKYVAIGGLSS